MSGAAAAGALAICLAVTCAVLVPFAQRTTLAVRFAHPDLGPLADIDWRRPLWVWEALRATCIAAGAALSALTSFPLVPLVAFGATIPSIVARSRAAGARSRAVTATTRLLRATEAGVRSGASLPEALRRACAAVSDDRLTRRPFVEALRAFDLGAPLDQALRATADQATSARTRIALETIAMGIALRLPYDRAGALIASVTDRLAFEERLDEEIRARTGGLRSQVLLLALVVPAIALYLALTVPSLATTLGQPLGRFVLIPIALALEAIGLIASRRAIEVVRR
jgi:Flp pilus assembly protein TadB